MNQQLLYPVNSVQQRMMMNLLLIIPQLIQTIMVHAVHVYYNITCMPLYIAPSRDTLYSGMMYYEKKEVGHWKTMYSVVRDLEVLKRVMHTRCTYTYFYY